MKMEKKRLAGTDLQVSPMCLGTVKYGSDMGQADAFAQMDRFCALGGNFMDTAHVYGDWCPVERAASEHVIGRWFKSTGKRHEVVLSTKGAHPALDDFSVSRVTAKDIVQDLDESLAALQTDYIDLYFLHRDNPALEPSEILYTLEQARRQGKIRFYGCSNWALPRVRAARQAAEQEGFAGFACNQLMWSLADIRKSGIADKTLVAMDKETYAYHVDTGMAVMAYTSVAKGYLSKKARGQAVSDADEACYGTPVNQELLQLLTRAGLSVSAACFAYLMQQPFSAFPIATFRTDAQMDDAFRACSLQLPGELLERIGRIKQHAQ